MNETWPRGSPRSKPSISSSLDANCARRSDWKGAMPSSRLPASKQPDHFWARCLLAICHFQVDQPALRHPRLYCLPEAKR